MSNRNIFYAQSGGATAVINATACGVIETAANSDGIGQVYAGKNGIVGALQEELIDVSQESPATIAALKYTPGCAFGSCRFRLTDPEKDSSEYERLIEVFRAHDIGTFLYNGGGDSHDTAHKVSVMSKKLGYPLTCIGLPKTIDNDLAITDNSPGFGSVAKYVAISTQETALDLLSMCETSTKVFILEVMGRHAGWIAAASALGKQEEADAPHIILLPETPFQQDEFLNKVRQSVDDFGACFIVVSEGLRHADGRYVSEQGLTDAFGHEQLGGVAPSLARLVKKKLGYKYHYAVADYLQRSARHIGAQTDVDQAYALGCRAVELALSGANDVMLTINRTNNSPYAWEIGTAPLGAVANIEKKLPQEFIAQNGMGVTNACLDYMRPLIQGESYPEYVDGIPRYARLKKQTVPTKLTPLPQD